MLGNINEWIEDDLHSDYNLAPNDGSAWIDDPRGSARVQRGGSRFSNPENCRSAERGGNGPAGRGDTYGCRLVRASSSP